MRVALVSDIHGHLMALDAVLAECLATDVDVVANLGDIALSGPRPGGTVQRARSLNGPAVKGNCGQLSVDFRAHGVTPSREPGFVHLGAWVREIDVWSSQALTDGEAAWLAALPMTARVELGPGAALLLAHGSPTSNTQRITPDMPDEALRAALAGVEREPGVIAYACGHTHLPMVRTLDGLTVINPGSVGMPMAKDAGGSTYNPLDYAEYALVTWDGGALTVDLRRAALDPAAIRADAASSGMPRLDRWRGDMRRN